MLVGKEKANLWYKTHNYISFHVEVHLPIYVTVKQYISGVKPVYMSLSPREHCQAQSNRVLRFGNGTKSSCLCHQ